MVERIPQSKNAPSIAEALIIVFPFIVISVRREIRMKGSPFNVFLLVINRALLSCLIFCH